MQFRSRGVETFANMYSTNAWVLENEAKDHAAWVYQQTVAANQQNGFGLPSAQPTPQATSTFANFSYYNVNNGLYVAVSNGALGGAPGVAMMGYLYPCDPQSGLAIGPPVGVMTLQQAGPYAGQYVAFDNAQNAFLATRLK